MDHTGHCGMSASKPKGFTWRNAVNWKRASVNTAWCLLGCSIGDMGTIAFFQWQGIAWNPMAIMALATVNGILTSIALETFILSRQMALAIAFRTAIGMSLISMLAMEAAMNLVDYAMTGGATLNWWVLPIMWSAGFLAPLPYNYWRLQALGKACH